jgi:hypothetical protein
MQRCAFTMFLKPCQAGGLVTDGREALSAVDDEFDGDGARAPTS